MNRPIKTARALGSAIRDARKARGWTQATLAEHAGVTQATVSTFERGEGNPTLSTVLALASASGLNLVARLRQDSEARFPWASQVAEKPTDDLAGGS